MKAKEKVTQKVESIFKKPHRAAGKLTVKERKFEEECTSEKKEMFDEENQVKVPEQVEVLNGEKKRVRLTVGVKPEDDREKKKRVPNGWGGGKQRRYGGGPASIQVTATCGRRQGG